uniref:B2126_F2_97 n=1 Tax=Mycobacterium leprae TaxID=1769 RepID=Q49802_MYCLR|nr:B2126_F2_97 [Mycobacterium leprae]
MLVWRVVSQSWMCALASTPRTSRSGRVQPRFLSKNCDNALRVTKVTSSSVASATRHIPPGTIASVNVMLSPVAIPPVYHIRFVDVPAFVSWNPPFGIACYDLAVALTFYLLNIRIPLRRDQCNTYRHPDALVGLVVTQGNQLMIALNIKLR